MEETDKTKFSESLTQLQLCYPSAQPDAGRVIAYWAVLRRYSLRSVRFAMARAMAKSPEFLPSAESIRQHAEAYEKCGEPQKQGPNAGLLTEGNGPILPPDSPYEKLARKWEQQISSGQKPSGGEISDLVGAMAGKMT